MVITENKFTYMGTSKKQGINDRGVCIWKVQTTTNFLYLTKQMGNRC